MATQAMPTAAPSAPPPQAQDHAHSQAMGHRPSAVESAVDAYATRVLGTRSPPEACVEPELGPYVTSVLRSCFSESPPHGGGIGIGIGIGIGDCYQADAVEGDIPEFDSLMELLEEHCGMSPEVARSSLRSIAVSVRTGVVDPFGEDAAAFAGAGAPHSFGSVGGNSLVGSSLGASLGGGSGGGASGSSFGSSHLLAAGGRSYRSVSVGGESEAPAASDVEINMLGAMLQETGLGDELGTQGQRQQQQYHHQQHGSDSSDQSQEHEAQTSFVLDEDIPGYGANVDNRARAQGGSASGVVAPPAQSTPGSAIGGGGANATPAFTPVKLDALIPVDLLGVLDDPCTPAPAQPAPDSESSPASKPEEKKDDGAEPSAAAAADAVAPDGAKQPPAANTSASAANAAKPPLAFSGASSDNLPKKGKGKKKSKAAAQELAASLFRPSRSRSNSVPSEKSPMLRPMVGAPDPSSSSGPGQGDVADHSNVGGMPSLFQQQLDSAAQILLSMNGSLGEEAAMEAALVSNADVNVAQYVIDGAMSASPVCRHLLNGGCYRSDCQFSHDVDGHTCLFWLRGRCNKGETCQFLHGFCEKLLDGIKADFLPHPQNGGYPEGGGEEANLHPPGMAPNPSYAPIQTSNLLQHNTNAAYSVPKQGYGSSSFLSASHESKSLGAGAFDLNSPFSVSTPQCGGYLASPTFSSSVAPSLSAVNGGSELGPPALVGSESSNGINPSAPAFSFANVASNGYDDTSSFAQHDGALFKSSKVDYARIPQDLWNPSERRDAGVFHIPDPMQRYAEVSATQPRQDVIDLHFQSVKTFAVVLSNVLPDKLRDHGEVWVVTGSGHHVDRNSHQRSGGVLEDAVLSWLDSYGYDYARGKDRNGYGGAVLVRQQ